MGCVKILGKFLGVQVVFFDEYADPDELVAELRELYD